MREEFISKNPMKLAERPTPEKAAITALEHHRFADFLEAIEHSPYRVVYLVALFTGMRRSELLGLTWEHVSFEPGDTHAVIAIRQTLQRVTGQQLKVGAPKTKKANRDIVIEGLGFEALRALRPAQKAHALERGMHWSEKWYVFCLADGKGFDGHYVTRDFRACMDSIGITDLTFHGLRHTYASWLVEAKEDYKAIADSMGHETITTFLDMYTHPEQAAGKRVASTLAKFAEGS